MSAFVRNRPVILIALIAVLLPAAAILQYRWLGELSDLEQLRARTNIDAAARRFSSQFDTLLAGLYATFHAADSSATPADADRAIEQALRTAPRAELIERLYVLDRAADGTFVTRTADHTHPQLAASTWPAWLDAAATASTNAVASPLPPGLRRSLLDEVPAIVVKQSEHRGDRWVVIVLNLRTIADDLLPAMLAGCFEGGIPVTYDMLINREDGGDQVVYQSRKELTRADFRSWVTLVPMFALHTRDLDAAAGRSLMADAAAHRWRLFVKPQSGALEAAVGAARTRNLGIGISVLALLAVSVILLVMSMHSVQRAAREQLELVARISHELRTPVATITCAGENLADNLVETPAETRHYGELIVREGRRLTRTLGDILLCCRLQARQESVLNFQPTDIAAVIDRAMSESLLVAGDDGARIDKTIEPGLPAVVADAEAMKMAVKNLLVNAIKHGGGRPVRISARSRRAAGGRDVWIAVDDEGPGIPDDELSRIFEPFFRGRIARNLEIEGSGIGLSIVRQVVQAHGGRIRVSSGDAQGTRFTLQLRAIKAGHSMRVQPAA